MISEGLSLHDSLLTIPIYPISLNHNTSIMERTLSFVGLLYDSLKKIPNTILSNYWNALSDFYMNCLHSMKNKFFVVS